MHQKEKKRFQITKSYFVHLNYSINLTQSTQYRNLLFKWLLERDHTCWKPLTVKSYVKIFIKLSALYHFFADAEKVAT